MGEFFGFIFLLISLFFIYKITKNLWARILLIIRLGSLKKTCNAKVRYLRFPLFSFFKLSARPDISVEIGDTVYLIRTIGAGGSSKSFHFASPNFTVTYTPFSLMITGRRRSGRGGGALGVTGNPMFTKVRYLPDLQIPDEFLRDSRKTVVPVLIFNPAPGTLTHVTEEKNRISLAFTGDEFYGYKIFTASTFVSFADREAHRDMNYHFYS